MSDAFELSKGYDPNWDLWNRHRRPIKNYYRQLQFL
jgi:hypothetical protein